MNLEGIKKGIEASHGFEENIGMEFVSTPEDDECVAKMHVDKRNKQPFGYLSGGASIALAETLAGIGSYALDTCSFCVGMNVTANHIHSAAEGETVTARAKIIHQGLHTHVWKVDVVNEKNDLISVVTVTNFVKLKSED